ncbi:hypothetical protein HKX48_000344 [Thoreauomyces humboldtii]|nr:hypothetical protein HKX48_000344 [Thoreauomyces humboldtii]
MPDWALYAEQSGLPHYEDSSERIASIILLAVSCVGVLGNAFVAHLFYRFEHLRRYPSNLLILALCLGDGLMCSPRLVEIPIVLANRGYPVWYHPYCQLFGAMTYTSSYMSGYTLSAVSLERYFAIVKGKTVTRRQCLLISIGIWSFAVMVATVLPVVTAIGKGVAWSPYVMQSSGLYCLIDWGDTSAAGRAQVIIALFTLAMCVLTIVGGYSMIYRHVKRVGASVKDVKMASMIYTTTSTPSEASDKHGRSTDGKSGRGQANATMSALERALLWKGIIMSAVFLVNWMPYTAMIFYEAVLGRHDVPKGFETISWFGSVLNAVMDPVLFITLDTRVRACACRSLGCGVADDVRNSNNVNSARTRGTSRPELLLDQSRQRVATEMLDDDLVESTCPA